MLPSNQRLTRQQVTLLLNNPEIKVIFNRLGTFKYITSSNKALTVVTGSKNQKKAVARNKLRRQIYSLFNQYKGNIALQGILYVSKQAYDMTYIDITRNLYALLEQSSKNS
jgi:ribonuclease P protein component